MELLTRLERPLLVVVLCALAAQTQYASELGEHELKAAFILGFAKFVEWPPQQGDLIICTIDSAPLDAALKQLVAQKEVAGRRVSVRKLSRKDGAGDCAVLVLPASGRDLFRGSLRDILPETVLTVGDGPAFLESGGMLQFVWEGNKVQFEANLAAIQRSGLRVSSRLLRLARNLRQNTKDGRQ